MVLIVKVRPTDLPETNESIPVDLMATTNTTSCKLSKYQLIDSGHHHCNDENLKSGSVQITVFVDDRLSDDMSLRTRKKPSSESG
jgi:hypothetical protein